MEIKLSRHFMLERAGRYAYISTTVGIGEVVHTVERINDNSKELVYVSVTNTGVVLVRGVDGTIITMYLAYLEEVKKYFNNSVPFVLASIINTNMKRGYIKHQNDFD